MYRQEISLPNIVKGEGSRPIYKVKVEKNIHVNLRDGVLAAVDVYRPEIEGKKFPGLLAISPFGKELQEIVRWLPPQPWVTAPLWDGCLESGDIDYMVSRGYVFVIGDPRGIGCSEGEYVGILGSMAQDGYDLVEWIAQQPWCDGNVGMMGSCIFAAAQLLVAAEQPPHLKAITPLEFWADVYRHLAYHGGILYTVQHAVYTGRNQNDSGYALGNVTSKMIKTRPKEEVERLFEETLNNPDIRYNSKFYSLVKHPKIDPTFIDFLLNPTDGPFWQEISPYTKFEKIKIPTYIGVPWCRENFIWPAFEGYDKIKAPQKLLLWPPRLTERPFHEYHDEIVRWYDYWLKGIDTGIMDEPPIKMFVMGINKWRFEHEWPLARTEWVKFYLHSQGRLSPEPVASGDHQPESFSQPPPTVTSIVKSVQYRTSPLPHDGLEVTGPIALSLYASIDADDTNWIVDLNDVDPSGRKTAVSRGYLKASHRAVDVGKSKPYKPYHPHTRVEPVTPGEIYEYAIELMPASNVFKGGHSIELVIRSQDDLLDKPAMWGTYHLPSSGTINHKIYFSKSHLLLPIIPQK